MLIYFHFRIRFKSDVCFNVFAGNERVLFMRLHLLQGIINHYKNHRDQALEMFEKVEAEIRDLKVDFENVNVLRNLGICG